MALVAKKMDLEAEKVVGLKKGNKGSAARAYSVFPVRELGLYFNQPEYREFALWMYDWHQARQNWIFKQAVLVAMALAAWKKDVATATGFWGEVFTGSNKDRESPSRELLTTLTEALAADRKRRATKFRREVERCWRLYEVDSASPKPEDSTLTPALQQPSV